MAFSPPLQGRLRAVLECLLDRLPDEERRVVSRRFFDRMSLRQACRACRDIPLLEAQTLFRRARDRFRRRLAEDPPFLGLLVQLASRPGPGSADLRRRIVDRLVDHASLLAEEEGRLFERVCFGGLNLPEAAICARDIPYATAHALLARALLRLRDWIQGDEDLRQLFDDLGLSQP
jgi:DNA-directed RNA polymerase specialized sigma24 family protein